MTDDPSQPKLSRRDMLKVMVTAALAPYTIRVAAVEAVTDAGITLLHNNIRPGALNLLAQKVGVCTEAWQQNTLDFYRVIVNEDGEEILQYWRKIADRTYRSAVALNQLLQSGDAEKILTVLSTARTELNRSYIEKVIENLPDTAPEKTSLLAEHKKAEHNGAIDRLRYKIRDMGNSSSSAFSQAVETAVKGLAEPGHILIEAFNSMGLAQADSGKLFGFLTYKGAPLDNDPAFSLMDKAAREIMANPDAAVRRMQKHFLDFLKHIGSKNIGSKKVPEDIQTRIKQETEKVIESYKLDADNDPETLRWYDGVKAESWVDKETKNRFEKNPRGNDIY